MKIGSFGKQRLHCINMVLIHYTSSWLKNFLEWKGKEKLLISRNNMRAATRRPLATDPRFYQYNVKNVLLFPSVQLHFWKGVRDKLAI